MATKNDIYLLINTKEFKYHFHFFNYGFLHGNRRIFCFLVSLTESFCGHRVLNCRSFFIFLILVHKCVYSALHV